MDAHLNLPKGQCANKTNKCAKERQRTRNDCCEGHVDGAVHQAQNPLAASKIVHLGKRSQQNVLNGRKQRLQAIIWQSWRSGSGSVGFPYVVCNPSCVKGCSRVQSGGPVCTNVFPSILKVTPGRTPDKPAPGAEGWQRMG
jgi:hypothetical protein